MKIKYVGLKQFESAFSNETGVTWAPGAVHDIKDVALAARMLKHPDVFAVADTASAERPPAPPAPPPDETGNVPGADDAPRAKWIMRTDDGKPLVLDALDRDTLHKLADEAGLKIHANAKAETVAARLAEAFPWAEEA